MTHGLRCNCGACLVQREEIRRVGLIRMRADGYSDGQIDRDRWADRKWDGALAGFPGRVSGERHASHDAHDEPIGAVKLA